MQHLIISFENLIKILIKFKICLTYNLHHQGIGSLPSIQDEFPCFVVDCHFLAKCYLALVD